MNADFNRSVWQIGLIPDTWAWNGEEWVQIGEFGPSARLYAAVASMAGGDLVLYGGKGSIDLISAPSADTWAFDGKLWTQRQDIGPGPLQLAAMTFDSARNTLVLFGGLGVDGAPNSGSTWEAPAPAQAAPPGPSPSGTPPAALTVSSIQVTGPHDPNNPNPGVFTSGNILTLTITLSGPAQAGGAVVSLSGPVQTQNGAALTSVTIPAGSSTASTDVLFLADTKAPVSLTISAQLPPGPSVSTVVQVSNPGGA